MIIGAVADIHGNFDALTSAIHRHPEVPLWICGAINDVLVTLQPRLHLCGHHHRYARFRSRGRPLGLHRPHQPVVPANRRGDARIQED
jgi:hypothetical protein